MQNLRCAPSRGRRGSRAGKARQTLLVSPVGLRGSLWRPIRAPNAASQQLNAAAKAPTATRLITLHDPHCFAAELTVDNWPPRDKDELTGFLDHGKLAARQLRRVGAFTADVFAVRGGAERQHLALGHVRARAANLGEPTSMFLAAISVSNFDGRGAVALLSTSERISVWQPARPIAPTSAAEPINVCNKLRRAINLLEHTVFRDDLERAASVEELEALSGKKRRARLEAIRDACSAYITDSLRENLAGLLADETDGAGRVEIDQADPDGQTLLLWYPRGRTTR